MVGQGLLRRFFLVFSFLIVASVLVTDARAQPESPTTAPTSSPVSAPRLSGKLGAPIALFNGKNFDGWTWFTPSAKAPSSEPSATRDQVWSIADGVLHCTGKPPGYLRTERSFSNFVLTVEQRHLAKGNGGIFFSITVPDKIWPTCVEVQGQSGQCGDLRVSEELKVSAEPAGRVQGKRIVKLSESSEKPIGEWDTVEITVDRGNITVKVNGQLQNVATSAADLTGTIGLQSEGSAMEFRKVELRPIEQEVR